MKMAAPPLDVKLPILSQPQFCEVAGVDMVTANNWVSRKVLEPTQTGGHQVKGTRRYSIARAYEGRIISELVVHHKIPPSDAAKIAKLATEGGWIEHWLRALAGNRKFVKAFLVAGNRQGDCYESQIIDVDKDGLPNFTHKEMKRFLEHPFIVLPLRTIFMDVYEKSLMMLGISM